MYHLEARAQQRRRLAHERARQTLHSPVVQHVVNQVHRVAACAFEEHVLIHVLAVRVRPEVNLRQILRRLPRKHQAQPLRRRQPAGDRADPEHARHPPRRRSPLRRVLHVEHVAERPIRRQHQRPYDLRGGPVHPQVFPVQPAIDGVHFFGHRLFGRRGLHGRGLRMLGQPPHQVHLVISHLEAPLQIPECEIRNLARQRVRLVEHRRAPPDIAPRRNRPGFERAIRVERVALDRAGSSVRDHVPLCQ